jgi:DNA-binding HxlR family transcriptional regulator
MAEEFDAELLRDLGQTTRLKIIGSLIEGEKNVSELLEIIGDVPQGRLSTHLT